MSVEGQVFVVITKVIEIPGGPKWQTFLMKRLALVHQRVHNHLEIRSFMTKKRVGAAINIIQKAELNLK